MIMKNSTNKVFYGYISCAVFMRRPGVYVRIARNTLDIYCMCASHMHKRVRICNRLWPAVPYSVRISHSATVRVDCTCSTACRCTQRNTQLMLYTVDNGIRTRTNCGG